MRFSDQDFNAIAEELLLKHTVFIHKKTCQRLVKPSNGNTVENCEVLVNTSDDAYLQINPPPLDAPFLKSLHTNFLLSISYPDEQKVNLWAAVDIYQCIGDETPFLRLIEKLGLLDSWLAYQKSSYKKFVEECLYPFNEKLIFIQ